MKSEKLDPNTAGYSHADAAAELYLPQLKSNSAVVELVQIEHLVFPARELRSRSPETMAALTTSVKKWGVLSPPLISASNEVIVGRARIEAARLAGHSTVPVIRVHHLSQDEIRLFRIADNKLVERAEWTLDLGLELQELAVLEVDLELTGFSVSEIDIEINGLASNSDESLADEIPGTLYLGARSGDLWVLGRHRLLCASCLDTSAYLKLMGDERARMVLTDPPYNLAVASISGLGRAQHSEFAMASGEMSEKEFTAFQAQFMKASLGHLVDGGLIYVFMDWRHTYELGAAQRELGLQLLNICTWAKTNGGMGSFYRSATEFCFVMKYGSAPHQNNVQLGKYGRYRTTLWSCAGANSFRKGRDDDLAAHPTVKPTALFADAILDASKRGEIVLDPFAGSGTTILAAERTGRRARAIEIEPRYVSEGVKRWQKMTGKSAILEDTGETFEEVVARRSNEPLENATPVRQRVRTTPVLLPGVDG